MTREEMLDQVQGYEKWYNPIDQQVAEEDPCDECGAKCHFEGFAHGDSHRAFAVCENGHCYEF